MQKGLNEKLEADYVRPASLETAVSALASGPRVILAGGTDVFPGLQDRPLLGPVLDISGIAALKTIDFVLGAYIVKLVANLTERKSNIELTTTEHRASIERT